MAQETKNFKLVKPELNDNIERTIPALADNFEKIDVKIKDVDSQLAQTVYYDEIKVERRRDSLTNTEYWITKIPYLDNEGNLIKIKKGFANDSINSNPETPRSFADRTGASVVSNASIWSGGSIVGIHIKDGQVFQDTQPHSNYILGFTEDRTMKMYPPTTPIETIIDDGVTNTWTAFYPMIINGIEANPDIYNVISNPSEPNPRNVISMLPNKDLILFTCAGREDDNIGMTYSDCIRILKEIGVEQAYCLDGGGSAQTIVYNSFYGGLVDNNMSSERQVYDFIYFQKESNKSVEPSRKAIGDISVRTRRLENRLINKYGDDVKGRLKFKDYIYLDNGKALYGYKSDGVGVERLLYISPDDRMYIGDPDLPISIQSSNSIIFSMQGQSYYVGVVPNNPSWIKPVLLGNWRVGLSRNIEYIKVQDRVNIRGLAIGGQGGTSDFIFTLPSDLRPKQQIIIPVSVMSGQIGEINSVVIYPNGNVCTLHPFQSPTENTGVHIDLSFTTL